jgi:hypothetical protein
MRSTLSPCCKVRSVLTRAAPALLPLLACAFDTVSTVALLFDVGVFECSQPNQLQAAVMRWLQDVCGVR